MRVHSSVAIVLVLADPCSSHSFDNAFGTQGCPTRRPIDKKYSCGCSSYYEIRSETERLSGEPTKMNVAQPAAAAHRRMP
jgi:hypothetical protein